MIQISIGKWTLGEILGKRLSRNTFVMCKCECGTTKRVLWQNLKDGHSKSCGCRHGHERNGAATKTYNTWHRMRQRCDNPNDARYAQYGDRGISYHPSWVDFRNFLRDVGEIPEGMTIDRIDNNGNYELGNIRFADWKTQANNRSNNKVIQYRGRAKTLAQWIDELQLPYNAVANRLFRGWNVVDAFERPFRKSPTKKSI